VLASAAEQHPDHADREIDVSRQVDHGNGPAAPGRYLPVPGAQRAMAACGLPYLVSGVAGQM
jgi:hypothetical protein